MPHADTPDGTRYGENSVEGVGTMKAHVPCGWSACLPPRIANLDGKTIAKLSIATGAAVKYSHGAEVVHQEREVVEQK